MCSGSLYMLIVMLQLESHFSHIYCSVHQYICGNPVITLPNYDWHVGFVWDINVFLIQSTAAIDAESYDTSIL